ncbi:hypothetical protein [Paenibacillus sp. NPDC057967]|uniref:hypothetical protein n=1 Tax=Paenibacillus sp. NPDC057967 TaxID=3346293 RepID=UPI0036DF601C
MKRKVTVSALITALLFSILFSAGVINAYTTTTYNQISDYNPSSMILQGTLSDHTYTNYHEFYAPKSGYVEFMVYYGPGINSIGLNTQLLDSSYNVLYSGLHTSRYVNAGERYYLKVTSQGKIYKPYDSSFSQNYIYSAFYTP